MALLKRKVAHIEYKETERRQVVAAVAPATAATTIACFLVPSSWFMMSWTTSLSDVPLLCHLALEPADCGMKSLQAELNKAFIP